MSPFCYTGTLSGGPQASAQFLLTRAGGLWGQPGPHHAQESSQALSTECPSGQTILLAEAGSALRAMDHSRNLRAVG